MKSDDINGFIRDIYRKKGVIALHEPIFAGNEKKYINEAIDSTFVSSVGRFVNDFELQVENFTGTKKAVSTMNGTAALHASLYAIGVGANDLVITQSLTFVATCNTICHLGAEPILLDISKKSLGLCPKAVESFLKDNADVDKDFCVHRKTGKKIKAVVPMHTFGHPVELDELVALCVKWKLQLVEDAAESLGSFYKKQHTGTFGIYGAVSFNGNKIITTGGGGMVLCRNKNLGKNLKHLTTTAKVPHPYEFFHDKIGFNYRMTNLNAALGYAQMQVLALYLRQKRRLAKKYQSFFSGSDYKFVEEPDYAKSNYWLNSIVCPTKKSRDELIQQTNTAGIMLRPIWRPMHQLPAFRGALRGDLSVTERFGPLILNLPSSPVE